VRTLLVCLPALAATAAGAADEYRVTFAPDASTARVTATLAATGGRLSMAAWGADMHPRGWAHYVRNLRVTDEGNRALEATADPKAAAWQIAPTADLLRIEYNVDLSFARTDWPYGNEQAGLWQDGALFLVSKALFIASDAPGPRHVRIDAPATWSVSTPWPPVKDDPRDVTVAGRDALLDNSLVVGRHAEHVVQVGKIRFVLALLGTAADSRAEVVGALKPIVEDFGAVFPATAPTQYLMTILPARERDAEAFQDSAAFSETEALTADRRPLWANTMAHELFHAWNGHAIAPAEYATAQWFTEGFTEYFATRALVHQGVVTEDAFLDQAGRILGLYTFFKSSPAFSGVTLKQSGAKKGHHRLGVYDGGWVVAFALDVQARAAGARTLDDAMRLLYERFGRTARKYTYEELVATLGEGLGQDLRPFFARYVEGDEILPIEETLRAAGYLALIKPHDGEVYLRRDPNASAKAEAVRKGLLGRP
jgi:predicted metalloprotease with PDZ domain